MEKVKKALFCAYGTKRDRQNEFRILVWTFLWTAAWLGILFALKRNWLAVGAPAIAATALSTLLGVRMLWAYRRFLIEADELRRKIELEALALAFGIGMVAGITYPILEEAGAIAEADIYHFMFLLIVTYFSKRLGLSARLGSLIAVGTSICGATAIVATAPSIGARDDEVAYSIACITLFGVIAMLVYPFLAHWMFAADPFSSGLFLGTAIHETAQVAGAGLVYQEYFGDPDALNVATVTKLVRNLAMLVVIPLMAIAYHRKAGNEGDAPPPWWTMVPLFVIGFACMSLIRTIGDATDPALGLFEPEQWNAIIGWTKNAAEYCLAIAMAAVGLGTSVAGLKSIGLKPLGVGLFSALLVGVVSASLIALLY